jgi:hypothetical protein
VIHLGAASTLRPAAGEVAALARDRFGGELRRAGAFTQLCLLGAQQCLGAAQGAGPLGVLCSSGHGAIGAARAALAEEPLMPFTFIATQPHLAAAVLAQRSGPVSRAACVHVDAAAWPWLLRLAQAWLAGCERVLVGWVEEAVEAPTRSDWCLFQRAPSRLQCEATRQPGDALEAAASDWISRVAAWHAGSREPLALRGGGEAWRFTSA